MAFCVSNTSENRGGNTAAVRNFCPSAASQRAVSPGIGDAQRELETGPSSSLQNALCLPAVGTTFTM